MLVKYLLLALLPAIAFSYITVVVKSARNMDDAAIDHTGYNIGLVTDQEKKLFGLSNDTLKRASKKYNGEACTSVYVNPPTPWGDIYIRYGWKKVQSKYKPMENRIVKVKTENVTLSRSQFHNRFSKRTVTYHSRAQAEVNETIKHTWSGAKLNTSDEVRYRVTFGAVSAGGMTTLQYRSTFGKKDTQHRRVLLGGNGRSSLKIAPNQTVTEELTAIKGTMDIEVDYEVILLGRVLCYYKNKHNGYNFYGYYLLNLERVENLTKSLTVTEKISITFYSYPRVELYVAPDHTHVGEFDGEIDEED